MIAMKLIKSKNTVAEKWNYGYLCRHGQEAWCGSWSLLASGLHSESLTTLWKVWRSFQVLRRFLESSLLDSRPASGKRHVSPDSWQFIFFPRSSSLNPAHTQEGVERGHWMVVQKTSHILVYNESFGIFMKFGKPSIKPTNLRKGDKLLKENPLSSFSLAFRHATA